MAWTFLYKPLSLHKTCCSRLLVHCMIWHTSAVFDFILVFYPVRSASWQPFFHWDLHYMVQLKGHMHLSGPVSAVCSFFFFLFLKDMTILAVFQIPFICCLYIIFLHLFFCPPLAQIPQNFKNALHTMPWNTMPNFWLKSLQESPWCKNTTI